MFGLRTKILLGFGGLLLILLAVSLLGETVLSRYSRAMQRSFKEDYTSVNVCQKMIESVDSIDSQFDNWCWRGTDPDRELISNAQRTFDERLRTQKITATLGIPTNRFVPSFLMRVFPHLDGAKFTASRNWTRA